MSMIGKSLAHYEITSQLGKGGMGDVDGIPFDMNPNGDKFLMMTDPRTILKGGITALSSRKINVVLNWFEELKERALVK